MFLLIGYYALVSFDQGQDILKTLSLSSGGKILRQTLFVYFAVAWWSWQSFRSSRVLLHFSYFNFWNYQPSYALRAQVLVPRMLASLPFFILAFGVYKAQGASSPFVFLLGSSGAWIIVLLHYRKAIIVWLRTKKSALHGLVPDYIPIKNGTYPARFIWDKQGKWIIFRLLVVGSFFTSLYIFPVSLPQYIGSAAVVLLAFGSWLIIAALLTFLEKYLKFPISFSVIVCLVVFSFFNNNHHIRKISGVGPKRPMISDHFKNWIEQRNSDKGEILDVYLVMAEGGGIRSAYWTSGVMAKLFKENPKIQNNLYAFSSVSGGSLGTTLTAALINGTNQDLKKTSNRMLKQDFLAPVTASLTFNDMLQRFIPFPIKNFDRMRVLEKSWEIAWEETKPKNSQVSFSDGFLQTFGKWDKPLLLLNSTHVESGLRTVVCNADLTELLPMVQVKDFFQVVPHDIPISTAVGLSSRFPFLTPPALITNNDGIWGSLVDGGYYENLGVRTMMDVYAYLKKISIEEGYQIRFNFIAIRNTKSLQREYPIRGMFEVISPMITFSNIWANTGYEALLDARKTILRDGNRLYEVSLLREDSENIPLGWYLSDEARKKIDLQLNNLNSQIWKE